MSDPGTAELFVPLPTIPGYDVLEKIGEGGMGVVYRATFGAGGRPVAIKILNPLAPAPAITRTITDSTPKPLDLQALWRESNLMAVLAHPNIVPLYGYGLADGRSYLVMEFIDGPTLRSRLRPGTSWPFSEVALILDSIARALSYIHEQGVLHLDLKPENVLCDPNGGYKLTDFGLARPRIDARTLSDLGLAQGTLDYCSPEQRYGLPCDPRADLFSLATIAYELVTGHLPGRVFVPAFRYNAHVPAAAESPLRRALARDPDERQSTVAEFRAEILAALAPP